MIGITEQPHPDVVFDAMNTTRYPGPYTDRLQGWRFELACVDGCEDGICSVPVSMPEADRPTECIYCGAAMRLISAADRDEKGQWSP